MTLTDGYLNVIPSGRTSLAGLYLAMIEARDAYYACDENTIQLGVLDTLTDTMSARTDEWFRVAGERIEAHGFHPLAFSVIRVPVEPSEGNEYLDGPRYSERIRRD